MRSKAEASRGFTLIELLIVIAIIGILAAIAIPNLLNALQRGKQKRTMADMRDLAIAIESYNTDNSMYPAAACQLAGGTIVTLQPGSFSLLKPTYISVPPVTDGWRNFLRYDPGLQTDFGYDIISYGRDGIAQGSPACGTTTDFNDDIIYTNGTFIQWPEGPQQ
jgi:type II secretion system protein G